MQFATSTFRAASRIIAASRGVAVASGLQAARNLDAGRKMLLVGGATLSAYTLYQSKDAITLYAAEKGVPIFGAPGTKEERTFIAVKPDGVHRGLIGEIISRFERKGYKLVAIKVIRPTKEFAEKHYADLKEKPFFPGLVNFFSSGVVVAMVWEGKGVIKGGRRLVGATDPNAAEDGSLRGDFCVEVGRNIVHGSDAPDSAEHEIKLWFKEDEVTGYAKTIDQWVYEK